MFSVIFEVKPHAGAFDDYLDNAKLLRPELEKVEGFIDNIRYKSLTREGWILSLSSWRDEKSVVRWRTTAIHHQVQEKGRGAIFEDYRLRVGQITADNRVPQGHQILEQRLDVTEAGEGTAMTLIDAKPLSQTGDAAALAAHLGLDLHATGLLGWDVFEAVLTPGDFILALRWTDAAAALTFETTAAPPGDARLRRVRIVRDYGMFDRREAPQYYPPPSWAKGEKAVR